MMSSLHVSSHTSTSTSTLIHVIDTLATPLSNSWSDPDCIARWLWPGLLTLTFALTFDQKLKFSKWLILLNFSCRFRFWTPFLHLNLPNWLIGTLFIVVSSKCILQGISKWSSHIYPTLSFHRASTLSLREGVRNILDILAQCNRPKPTLTCTSNLRFSRLYILILGFIAT